LFNWRRLAREGRLGEAAAATSFAAAFVADEPEQLKAPEMPACSAHGEVARGRIEIVLNSGHRVVVDKGVDATALARVLAVLVRR
jgi:transposase